MAAHSGYAAIRTGEGRHACLPCRTRHRQADSREIACLCVSARRQADLGLTVIHAGHYESETLGVKAVGAVLKRHLGLRTVFPDVAH